MVDKTKNKRCYCTLSPVTISRLESLAALGTHGDDVPGVMAHLIQTGIQIAIEKEYIPKMAVTPPAASIPSTDD